MRSADNPVEATVKLSPPGKEKLANIGLEAEGSGKVTFAEYAVTLFSRKDTVPAPCNCPNPRKAIA